ncbi:Uncharacterised protein [Neisseria zoodegmatis]|uniref:Uncharacterized protein n=1 Tax=Neisseria zoodegmatis TaxID=326523 RepID=A0A378X7X0_9NEIS|nr:Uncharacterised protein [Neisseria zoodegmatis]
MEPQLSTLYQVCYAAPDKSNFIKELIKERMMKEQAQQEKEY